MKWHLVLVSIIFSSFILSCSNKITSVKKTIYLEEYKELEKDSSKKYIELTILNIYPAELTCNDSEKYANLYVAKQLNGQLIYIFEYCQQVSNLVYDKSGRYVPIIDTSDILHDKQNKVLIFVPIDFKIPKNAKYLFSQIKVLNES